MAVIKTNDGKGDIGDNGDDDADDDDISGVKKHFLQSGVYF